MDEETVKKIAKIKLMVSRYGRATTHTHYGNTKGCIILLYTRSSGRDYKLSSIGVTWLDAWGHLVYLIRRDLKRLVKVIEAERAMGKKR